MDAAGQKQRNGRRHKPSIEFENESSMKSSRQWSLRRMFFWVFFAALICSQLSRIYNSAFVRLNDFTISENQIKELLAELDPSARTHDGGVGSGRSRNEVDSEFDFWISADTATAVQAISHLRESIIAKAEAEGWNITGQGQGGDESFELSLSKAATRFRIYCWVLSTGEPFFVDRLDRQGKNVYRILILQIGYAQP